MKSDKWIALDVEAILTLQLVVLGFASSIDAVRLDFDVYVAGRNIRGRESQVALPLVENSFDFDGRIHMERDFAHHRRDLENRNSLF